MKSKFPSKLIVAVMAMAQVLELNKTSDDRYEITGGIEGLFLKDLLTQLGLEYELVIPPDGEFGRLKRDGTWTGLIGMVANGDADLASNCIAMNEQRKQAIEFSTPFMIDIQTFGIKKTPKFHLKNAYLYPFRQNVWVCFFCMLVTISFTLWMVLKRKYSFGRIVFEFCGSVMKQPYVLTGNSCNSNCLLALCFGYALLLTSCYSGLLLAFLTIPREGETVKTIQQLSEAIARGTHRCYVPKGTMTVGLILSNNPHFKHAGKAIQQNKWYMDGYNSRSLTKFGYNDAVVLSRTLLELQAYQGGTEQKSRYLISDDVLATTLFGIAMSRNFCCPKRLNKIISRFTESGMFRKYIRDNAFHYWLSVRKVEENVEETYNRISITDISGALVILVVGYAISFATLIAEILFSKYFKALGRK